MTLTGFRVKARQALNVAGDALDRALYGRHTGTPAAHLDRVDELLGRGPGGEDGKTGGERKHLLSRED